MLFLDFEKCKTSEIESSTCHYTFVIISPDKLLTHEWGHLRWGLFDEYETDDDGVERFYATSRGDIEPTRCTDQVKGRPLNINTFGPCKRDPATGLYEEDCYFFQILEPRR